MAVPGYCGACQWFDALPPDPKTGLPLGMCRKNAPSVNTAVISIYEQPAGLTGILWPVCNAETDWCGEFLQATQVTPPTANGALTQTAGGTLAATTYYVVSTWVTEEGETTAGPETSLAVAANNLLTVAPPASPPPSVSGWKVYVGTAAGAETLQSAVTLGSAWVEQVGGLAIGSPPPPTTNTA